MSIFRVRYKCSHGQPLRLSWLRQLRLWCLSKFCTLSIVSGVRIRTFFWVTFCSRNLSNTGSKSIHFHWYWTNVMQLMGINWLVGFGITKCLCKLYNKIVHICRLWASLWCYIYLSFTKKFQLERCHQKLETGSMRLRNWLISLLNDFLLWLLWLFKWLNP